ncbi:hypothetical protein [Holzapfeliella sp. JNUCC 72]
MKTVRDLSEELAVTKQSINYYIRQNKGKFDKHIKKIGQANKLDKEAQNIIRKHFKQSDRANQKKPENSDKSTRKQSEGTGKTQLEQSQEETIKTLKEELASRREELKMAQNLIDQQQRLTLQTNNTVEYLREENKQLKLIAENSGKNRKEPEVFENEPEKSNNSTQVDQKSSKTTKKKWMFWK